MIVNLTLSYSFIKSQGIEYYQHGAKTHRGQGAVDEREEQVLADIVRPSRLACTMPPQRFIGFCWV